MDVNEEIGALATHLREFLTEDGDVECTKEQFTIMIEHMHLVEKMIIEKAIAEFNIQMPDYME